ncbi:MAG: hypothetical protein GY749_21705 [Desulfobacteraceae bacterium]|nr:hypothetical protein [Desulfobacteraceae bacterium]
MKNSDQKNMSMPAKIWKKSQFIFVCLLTLFYSSLALVFLIMLFNFSKDIVHYDKDRINRELIAEFNYLKSLTEEPDKKKITVTDGYSDFTSSEWPLMTLSLSCYGARNLAMKNPLLKKDVSEYLKKAVKRMMTPEYYHFIVEHYGDPFKSDRIRDNAFYLGHFVLTLAFYREISGDSTYDDLFHKFCLAFYENFKQSPTLSLESYPGQCWSSEQALPLRALKIHDDIFGTSYSEVIFMWKKKMEEQFTDRQSGLLVSLYNKETGFVYQGPRTIPNTWTIMFLYDILPEFCRKLYMNTKRGMLIKRMGFPVFKEYLGKVQRSTPDTGPIIWSISTPSTCFAMGCAGIYGDREIFSSINVLANSFGLAVNWGNRRKYLTGGQIGTSAVFLCRSMLLMGDMKELSCPVKNMLVLFFLFLVLFFLVLWRLWKVLAKVKVKG